MVAIITGRNPKYTQSLHRVCTVARAPSLWDRSYPCLPPSPALMQSDRETERWGSGATETELTYAPCDTGIAMCRWGSGSDSDRDIGLPSKYVRRPVPTEPVQETANGQRG